MKKFVRGALSLSLFWLAPTATAQVSGTYNAAPPFDLRTILVKTKHPNDGVFLDNYNRRIGAQVRHKYDLVPGLYLVSLPAQTPVESGLVYYKGLPHIEYAEPNFGANVAPLEESNVRPNPSIEVNDPLFGNQWALHNTGQSSGTADADINGPETWAIETGSSSVVIGVIDSGVDYNHNDLAANLWQNSLETPGDSTDNDGNGYVDDVYGINAITGSGNPLDDYLHGTHVSGIIGAVTDNSLGIAGIMQNVQIASCKFLNSTGSGNASDALECVEYFADLKTRSTDPVNLVAINNSWTLNAESQAMADAIAALRDLGVLFIAAAGNNGTDNDATPRYPASYSISNVISVAATDRNDAVPSYSNYGKTTVHVSAPGSSIQSTVPSQNYGYLSGTSQAAPYVSGMVGILKSYNSSLTWSQIRNLIISGGNQLTALQGKNLSGRRLRGADSSGLGSLTCSSQVVKGRLEPIATEMFVAVGSTITLKALHINCDSPNGDVTLYNDGTTVVTLQDGGINGDAVSGDGVYTLDWTPSIAGVYSLDYGNSDVVSVRVYNPSSWHNYNVAVDSTFTKETITGTSLGAGNETLSTITSPFSIPIGGDSIGFSKLFISSNGAISVTDKVLVDGVNKNLPFSPPPDVATLIAPFWDDLTFSLSGADIYYQTLGSSPNRKLVIEWRNFRHFNSTAGSGTFQVIFYEGSANFRFSYIDTDIGSSLYNYGKSATCGIQLSSSLYKKYSYLQPVLTNSRSLYFTLQP